MADAEHHDRGDRWRVEPEKCLDGLIVGAREGIRTWDIVASAALRYPPRPACALRRKGGARRWLENCSTCWHRYAQYAEHLRRITLGSSMCDGGAAMLGARGIRKRR